MADFRDMCVSTDGELIENRRRLADHLLSKQPPPNPGGAIAWGQPDHETGTFPVYTEKGLWFVMDGETFKEIELPRDEPSEAEYVALLHDLADKGGAFAKCYFIGGEDGPVKIGYSIAPAGRLKAIQMYCPVVLKVFATAPGGEQRESAYHWQFRQHRLHGEWFTRHPDIMAEIERLNRL